MVRIHQHNTMSKKRTRRRFSAEFKARIAMEAARGVKTVGTIADENQLHPVQVSQWKKELLGKRPEIVPLDGFSSEPAFQAILCAARISPVMRAVGWTAACYSSASGGRHLVGVPGSSRCVGPSSIAWGVRRLVRLRAFSRPRCGTG